MSSPQFLSTPLCQSSREVIYKAEELRRSKSAGQVFTEALLIALSTDPDGSTRAVLQAFRWEYDAFLQWQETHGGVWKYPVAAIERLRGLEVDLSTLDYSARLQGVLELATKTSREKQEIEIRPRHLLAGILGKECKAHEWLVDMGINTEYAERILADAPEERAITAATFAFDYAPGSAFSDTAAERDALGFETSALALAEIIAKKETKAPIVIGVYGEWGTGKSTLMSLVKKHLGRWEKERQQKQGGQEGAQAPKNLGSRLQARLERLRSYVACFRRTDQSTAADDKEATRDTVICVEYNAWAYTDSEKLWTGLVEQVSKCLDQKADPCTRLRYWLDRNSRRLLGAMIVALIPAVLAVALIWVQELWHWAQDAAYLLRTAVVALGVWGSWQGWQLVPKQASLAEAVRVLIDKMDRSEIEGIVHDIQGEMKDAIRAYFGVSDESDQQSTDETQADKIRRPDLKVVVFIDELDRCPLEKIVDILEAIKLFLAEEIFIVLMAVDTRIVAEAIKLHYKDVENPDLAREYLEKIIQVPIPVPRADPDRFERFVAGLMNIKEEQGAPRPSSVLSDDHIREMMVPRPSGQRRQ